MASQNCHEKASGAFTGEVSVGMLKDLGVRWVILGHSERRHVFGEKDETMTAKVQAVQDGGMQAIICVGEKLEEREAQKTMEVCIRQMEAFASGIKNWDRIVIAYEPVWAIGTGKTATPELAQEVHQGIRLWLKEKISPQVASMRFPPFFFPLFFSCCCKKGLSKGHRGLPVLLSSSNVTRDPPLKVFIPLDV